MTVAASVIMGAGLRGVYIYEYDAAGFIKQGTMAVPYDGVHVQGGHIINVTDPAPRVITHMGEDRPLGLTVLPATTFVSGEMRSAKRNRTVDAIVTGTAEVTSGEAKFFGVGTNRRGYEPQVLLWSYSTSQNADEGSANAGDQLWDGLVLPKAKLIVRENNRDDNALEIIYDLMPFPVTKYPWGPSFSMSVEKFQTAAALTSTTYGTPRIMSALGDGAATDFVYNTGITAFATSKVCVYKNGASVNSGITVALDRVTFSAAPLVTDVIYVVLEAA